MELWLISHLNKVEGMPRLQGKPLKELVEI